MEREHGSVLRGMAHAGRARRAEARARGEPPSRSTGRMWSFREGLGLLIDGLRQRLRTPPLLGVTTRTVRRGPDGWQALAEGRDRFDADAVALTCPAYEQAALLADQDPALAELIGGIPYNRVAVVALGFRASDVPHRLDGFGYLSPQRSRRDVLGVQWCSSIFPDRAPPGLVLLRALCGGWHRADIVDWDDQRLLGAVRAEFALALGVRAAPVFHQIVRWDRAIPQYLVGHLDRVAAVEERVARHPGLFVGGNAYRGVALNDCVERAEALAEQAARFLLASISRKTP
jgi:oxygen-dependent protoporphyrinogen oxidase